MTEILPSSGEQPELTELLKALGGLQQRIDGNQTVTRSDMDALLKKMEAAPVRSIDELSDDPALRDKEIWKQLERRNLRNLHLATEIPDDVAKKIKLLAGKVINLASLKRLTPAVAGILCRASDSKKCKVILTSCEQIDDGACEVLGDPLNHSRPTFLVFDKMPQVSKAGMDKLLNVNNPNVDRYIGYPNIHFNVSTQTSFYPPLLRRVAAGHNFQDRHDSWQREYEQETFTFKANDFKTEELRALSGGFRGRTLEFPWLERPGKVLVGGILSTDAATIKFDSRDVLRYDTIPLFAGTTKSLTFNALDFKQTDIAGILGEVRDPIFRRTIRLQGLQQLPPPKPITWPRRFKRLMEQARLFVMEAFNHPEDADIIARMNASLRHESMCASHPLARIPKKLTLDLPDLIHLSAADAKQLLRLPADTKVNMPNLRRIDDHAVRILARTDFLSRLLRRKAFNNPNVTLPPEIREKIEAAHNLQPVDFPMA
jgi:hypothetical protein